MGFPARPKTVLAGAHCYYPRAVEPVDHFRGEFGGGAFYLHFILTPHEELF
jgi:hypothetical protein